MNARAYWFAFGIGVAAGALIALLYAPQTGTRTRRQLRNGVYDASDYLEDAGVYLKSQAERLGQEAQSAMKRTKSQVGGVVEIVSDVTSSALKQAKSLV